MNRVVTGYDQDGNPAIIRQGEPPTIIRAGRYTTTELWVSERSPVKATDEDTSTREWALEPPPGGACFRIVEIAPGVLHDWQNRTAEWAAMVGILASAK